MKLLSILSRLAIKPCEPTLLFKIILLLFSISGIVIILISTSQFGAGTTPDSVAYVSAARNFADGQGLVSYNGGHWIVWPPLYPVVLSIPAILFKIDPLAFAPVFNAVLFGLIIYMSGIFLSRHHLSNILYLFSGVVLILVSNILVDLYTMAWSETLFSFLVVVFILYTDKYLKRKDKTSLIIMSLSIALACLTRYAGICLILAGTIILFFNKKEGLWSRLFSIGIFILISALPLSLWLIRNFHISGTLTGERVPSIVTLTKNLELIFNTLREWTCFTPGSFLGNILFPILIFILLGLSVAFIFLRPESKPQSGLKEVLPLSVLVLVYILFLLLASTIFGSDSIGWRLLSPIYAPAVLLILILMEILTEPFRNRFPPLKVNSILIGVLLIWIIFYPFRISVINIHTWTTWGTGGFSNSEWKNNAMIKYLNKNPLESGHLIYSNESAILYILLDIRCNPDNIKLSERTPDNTDSGYDYFVYFNKWPHDYPYPIEDIQKSGNVEKIIQNEDGAVYRVYRIP